MNILFVGPLPPPLTGHSLVDKVLLDALKIKHSIKIINTSKDGFAGGIDSFKRIHQVISIFILIWKARKNNDAIYLTISESIAGNLKDILIYIICFKSLHKMVIHLHGGSFKRDVLKRHIILFQINKFFIGKLKQVIISGKSHLDIFSNVIDESKIVIIPNFAEDELFIDESIIIEKFNHIDIINVLFISNLIEGKGFQELADAFLDLDDNSKQKFSINIAGGADLGDLKTKYFLEKISKEKNIHYHGFINKDQKIKLLEKAHVLCFPSSLLEGQGLVVLEAYASGCVVITTASGGIKDIFENSVNGFQVKVNSSASIKQSLEHIMRNPEKLISIALNNRQIAFEKYRMNTYTSNVLSVIEKPVL